MVKTNALVTTEIAVVVDVGEAGFSAYEEVLGAPATRYFEKGGRECRRQWIVRHGSNPRIFRALIRQLRGKDEGEVVEVVAKMPSRVKKPEAA